MRAELLEVSSDPGAERVIARKTRAEVFGALGKHLLATMEKHVHADKCAFGTFKKIRWIQEKLLFPKLGSRPVDEITPQELLVRPGELRKAEWEHFDFGAAEWRIPARKMKMRAPHIVPLSRQALEVLAELKKVTGDAQFLFPKLGDRFRPMSENTVNKALRTMGYVRQEMTGHGFRSTASTLLNEHGWDHDAIERQLAHTERSGVRAAYNYAEHLPVRRQMLQAWADYLDNLRDALPKQARSIRLSAPGGSAAQRRTLLEAFNDADRVTCSC